MRKFNINRNVKVKLTKVGRAVYNEYYTNSPVTPPKIVEDAEGYSEWQMWELMQIFGSHVGMGIEAPFELNVLIDVK